MNKEDFIFFVECAAKAPSGHNTQPWKFENIEDGIAVHPDFSRSLPVVDPDNHALYISLGCATENIVISAKQKGYESKVEYPIDSESKILIHLQKGRFDNLLADDLFDNISKRQVNRSKYCDKKVPVEDLKMLEFSFKFEGISLLILNDFINFEKIVPFIIEGNNLQFNNCKFIEELTSWFRYSKKEAEKTKDGLWSACMGLPSMGRFIGNFVMKNFVSAKSEAKRLKKILQHTQGLAIFISDKNEPEHWVKTGQAFQRFALTASKLRISHSHLNMPCEETMVRYKLAEELGVKDKHPLLLLRYGYADKMPYSYRRNIEDILKKK